MFAFSVVLLVIMAVVMSYYASAAGWDDNLANMTRLKYGTIQGAWIAAAVFSWILVLVYLADLLAQCAFGYPSVRHVNS